MGTQQEDTTNNGILWRILWGRIPSCGHNMFSDRTLVRHCLCILSECDVCNLDKSITNTRVRSHFLSLLTYASINHLTKNLTIAHTKWLLSRNCRIEAVSFASTLTSEELLEVIHLLRSSSPICATDAPAVVLKKIDFRNNCNVLTKVHVKAMRTHYASVISVNLAGCVRLTHHEVSSIAQRCPQLTHLDLTSCENITTRSLKTLSQGCKQLTVLKLSWTKTIQSSALIPLSLGCRQLTEIDLFKCDLVTDAGIVALATGCSLLTTINLSRCRLLTDAAVVALAENCTRLAHVNLSYCTEITDVAVTTLATLSATSMRTLNLTHCQLTDISVFSISGHCPGIWSLNVSCCHKLTEASLHSIVNGCCRSLRLLVLSGCSGLPIGAPLRIISPAYDDIQLIVGM